MRRLGDSHSPTLAFVLVWAWGAVYALSQTAFDGKMAGKSFWEQAVLLVAVGLLGITQNWRRNGCEADCTLRRFNRPGVSIQLLGE